MPYCTRCDVEYREGFTTCADCGAPLADAPAPHAEPEQWAQLTEVARDTEARLIQGRLEAESIPCALESRTFTAEPVPSVRTLMRVTLHVPTAHLDRAREILEQCDLEAARSADEAGDEESET